MIEYESLKGISYLTGKDDCYGLARKFYRLNYELKLSNYARPFAFVRAGMDLISSNMIAEGFEPVDVSYSRLELGDAVIMAITGAHLANHVGIYVGNNYILHHLYKQKSLIETYDDSWKRRTMTIVRHPVVTEHNKRMVKPVVNITELLPPHVRAQYPA